MANTVKSPCSGGFFYYQKRRLVQIKHGVIIIGGGVAGYVAAIRGKQLGLDVAVVESDKLGGTCLHRGCIPTKALLESARTFRTILKGKTFGILCDNVQIDFAKIQAYKNQVVKRLHQGLNNIFKRERIPVYSGIARLLNNKVIEIAQPYGGKISLEAEQALVLATGSKPRNIHLTRTDSQRVLTTDQALKLEKQPKSIIIVGGGVIGVEFASLYSDLGIPVTLIEQEDSLLVHGDQEIQKEIYRQFVNRGIKVLLNTSITDIQEQKQQIIVTTDNQHEQEVIGDYCLICIGREANINNLGLEYLNIELTNGFVKVNSVYQTSEPNLFAIGDVIGGKMLAHAASYQGIRVMEYLAGVLDPHDSRQAPIPACIYSNPEIASIGLTEHQANQQGYKIKVSKFSLQANGKAVVANVSGFVKLIADAETDDLLGAHLIGPQATELISVISFGMFLDASSWELSRVIYPHPTVSEALGEAALALNSGAIHG